MFRLSGVSVHLTNTKTKFLLPDPDSSATSTSLSIFTQHISIRRLKYAGPEINMPVLEHEDLLSHERELSKWCLGSFVLFLNSIARETIHKTPKTD